MSLTKALSVTLYLGRYLAGIASSGEGLIEESGQEFRWKACYQGEELGARLTARFAPVTARFAPVTARFAPVTARFAPVTAQRVRLDIIESTDGPTIWEFQLLP